MAMSRPWWKIGVEPNAQHQPQPASFLKKEGGYSVAIIEYDDQGRCYDIASPQHPTQLQLIRDELRSFEGRDAIIVVFIHGWKHNGKSSDENLQEFCVAVQELAAQRIDNGVPILGIFVAWRGLSLYGLGLENLTFWGRKQAGLRVALGAPRELFGYLRQYRRKRLHEGGKPLLIMIGHSFGGLVTYSALAQSLVEAAATQSGKLTPAFADLVMLVNPAFEAERYLPINDIIRRDQGARLSTQQPPAFVSVTAHNDWATGLAFPIGEKLAPFHGRAIGREEQDALFHTMGHLAWLRTHELSVVDGSVVVSPTKVHANAPFWVAGATPEVIDGHNRIWLKPFKEFVLSLLLEHVRTAERERGLGAK